jgi:hypothetical protein
MTKAEERYMAKKAKDLKVYGYYTVTMDELEILSIEIEREEDSMAKKKVTKKSTKKKTSKKK